MHLRQRATPSADLGGNPRSRHAEYPLVSLIFAAVFAVRSRGRHDGAGAKPSASTASMCRAMSGSPIPPFLTYAGITPGSVVSGAQVNDAAAAAARTPACFEEVSIRPRAAAPWSSRCANTRRSTASRSEGNTRLDDDDLLPTLPIGPGGVPIPPSVAEQDANAIAEAYRVSGRLTATVSPRIIRRNDNRVDLVFEVAEGRVVETERISFVGNRAYSRPPSAARAGKARRLACSGRSSAATPSSRNGSRSTASF